MGLNGNGIILVYALMVVPLALLAAVSLYYAVRLAGFGGGAASAVGKSPQRALARAAGFLLMNTLLRVGPFMEGDFSLRYLQPYHVGARMSWQLLLPLVLTDIWAFLAARALYKKGWYAPITLVLAPLAMDGFLVVHMLLSGVASK